MGIKISWSHDCVFPATGDNCSSTWEEEIGKPLDVIFWFGILVNGAVLAWTFFIYLKLRDVKKKIRKPMYLQMFILRSSTIAAIASCLFFWAGLGYRYSYREEMRGTIGFFSYIILVCGYTSAGTTLLVMSRRLLLAFIVSEMRKETARNERLALLSMTLPPLLPFLVIPPFVLYYFKNLDNIMMNRVIILTCISLLPCVLYYSNRYGKPLLKQMEEKISDNFEDAKKIMLVKLYGKVKKQVEFQVANTVITLFLFLFLGMTTVFTIPVFSLVLSTFYFVLFFPGFHVFCVWMVIPGRFSKQIYPSLKSQHTLRGFYKSSTAKISSTESLSKVTQ